MITWERSRLKDTLKYLSDEQVDLLVARMQALSQSEQIFGLKLLSGSYPDPTPFGGYPQLPEVVQKQRKQSRSGPDETSEEWALLQQRVHALPPELFNEVEKLTLEAAFLAEIFPHQRAGDIVKNQLCICDDINLRALGRLDRSSRNQFLRRVWVENLWVLNTSGKWTQSNFAFTGVLEVLANIRFCLFALQRFNALAVGLHWTFRPVATHNQSAEPSCRFDKIIPRRTSSRLTSTKV